MSDKIFRGRRAQDCRRERLLGRRQRAGRGGADRAAAGRCQSRRARQPRRDPPPPLYQQPCDRRGRRKPACDCRSRHRRAYRRRRQQRLRTGGRRRGDGNRASRQPNGTAPASWRCVTAAHLGRIADWAEMAADAGLASFHFVNVTGIGASRVAPFGGSDGRLATNPIAAAIPRPAVHAHRARHGDEHRRGGQDRCRRQSWRRDAGWLAYRPSTAGRRATRATSTTSPAARIMPFGAYKGYGLSLFVDLFAGALIGAGGITHRHEVAGAHREQHGRDDRRSGARSAIAALRRRGRGDRRVCDGVETGGRRRCRARPRRSGAAHAGRAPRQRHSDRGRDVAPDRRSREIRRSNCRGSAEAKISRPRLSASRASGSRDRD